MASLCKVDGRLLPEETLVLRQTDRLLCMVRHLSAAVDDKVQTGRSPVLPLVVIVPRTGNR